jgi:hypothetical protein
MVMPASEKFLKIESAQQEIARVPFKMPFLESFIKNRDLIAEIARIAIGRIEVNQEDIIATCGDFFFHVPQKRHEKSVDFSYIPKEIEKVCHGERSSMIHFHGPYLGWQSDDDAAANQQFFKDGVNMGCAVGIDGIHCQTRTHPLRFFWDDEFYDKIRNERGIVTFKDVKSISCARREHYKNFRWLCSIGFKNGKGDYSNIFDEVDYEHSEINDMVAPFTMLEDRQRRSMPVSKSYHETFSDKDDVKCSIVEARNDTKRLLSCFKAG